MIAEWGPIRSEHTRESRTGGSHISKSPNKMIQALRLLLYNDIHYSKTKLSQALSYHLIDYPKPPLSRLIFCFSPLSLKIAETLLRSLEAHRLISVWYVYACIRSHCNLIFVCLNCLINFWKFLSDCFPGNLEIMMIFALLLLLWRAGFVEWTKNFQFVYSQNFLGTERR